MESRFDRLLRTLLRAETVCSVTILSVLIAVVSCQVFLRYVFNSPFPWAEELGALLLIYLSFVTGDVVYKKNAHISIDYVVGFFPARLRAWSEVVVGALICACLVSLMIISIPLIAGQFGFTTAAALPLSKAWWTMPVPFIFCSMILTTVNVIVHRWGTIRG